MRFLPVLAVVLLLAACGGPTTADLTVEVRAEGDPRRPSGLAVVNSSEIAWSNVELLLEHTEADGSTSPCGVRTIASWAPGEEVRTPACGERTRLTIETAEASAIYVFAGGTLYRRLGRKEVPVAR